LREQRLPTGSAVVYALFHALIPAEDRCLMYASEHCRRFSS
jgi:hypothetical protein